MRLDPALEALSAPCGGTDGQWTALAGDASKRRYWRFQPADGSRTLVLLHGPDPAENLAWLRIGRHLWYQGLPLPRIVAADTKAGLFLLEDLGSRHLADFTPGPERTALYCQATAALASFHHRGLEGFEPAWTHQTSVYDPALIYDQELLYFLTELVQGYLGLAWPQETILKEGRRFSQEALAGTPRVLMHRDFQSRNLMADGSRVHLLDWQGARLGPAAYDLASLLDDPYVSLSGELKEDLTLLYLKKAAPQSAKAFRRALHFLGAARLMQALGAYGKLTRAGRKGYEVFMLPAARRLAGRFSRPPLAGVFPRLEELVLKIKVILAALNPNL